MPVPERGLESIRRRLNAKMLNGTRNNTRTVCTRVVRRMCGRNCSKASTAHGRTLVSLVEITFTTACELRALIKQTENKFLEKLSFSMEIN